MLNQRMGVLAVQEVRALVPITIICHVRTFFEVVKVKVRRSSEVLLPMSIVAFRPLMLFVDVRTKTCLVRVNHEFLETHLFFMLVQIT